MNAATKLGRFSDLRRIPLQAWIIGIVLVVAFLILPMQISNVYYVQVLVLMVLYAYEALAWNIVGGIAGQISFGHGIFFGVGAYTSTILFRDLGLSPWVGMFFGALFAVLFAIIIGWPCFRLRGPYFSLATLACQEILRSIVNNTNEIFGVDLRGSRGIILPPVGHSPAMFQFENKQYFYYVFLAFLLIELLTIFLLKRGKFGLYLAAIKSNEDSAAVLGVNAMKMKLYALMISAFFAALGGTFYVQLIHFVDPEIAFGPLALTFVLFAICGGPTYLLGPVIGTLALMPIAEYTRAVLAGTATGIHMVIYGLVLVLVMLFIPKGLLDLLQKGYQKLMQSFKKGKMATADEKEAGN